MISAFGLSLEYSDVHMYCSVFIKIGEGPPFLAKGREFGSKFGYRGRSYLPFTKMVDSSSVRVRDYGEAYTVRSFFRQCRVAV